MGYLFLGISLLAGVTKGYCGKMTSGYVNGYKDAMLTNTIRMALCIVIGFGMILFQGNIAQITPNISLLAVSALSGITTSVFVVCWLLSVRRGAYMMLDVFLMLGVLVPLLAGRILFDETLRLTQWIGIFILFVAVYIMCTYNNSIKGKMDVWSLILLVICGVSNGLTDFSQKLFVKMDSGISISVFNFYTYLFSALTLLVFYFVFNKTEKQNKKEGMFRLRKILGYVFVMSLCLFMNSYFKTLAARYLSSVILYPVFQGGSLILSAGMSSVLFHERLNMKCIVGLLLAFLGLIVLNVL